MQREIQATELEKEIVTQAKSVKTQSQLENLYRRIGNTYLSKEANEECHKAHLRVKNSLIITSKELITR